MQTIEPLDDWIGMVNRGEAMMSIFLAYRVVVVGIWGISKDVILTDEPRLLIRMDH